MSGSAPVQAEKPALRGRRASRPQLIALSEAYALLALLGLVVLFFSVWSRTGDIYLTTANLQTVIGNQSVLAIAALAALIPLVAGELDLSVGATLGLASVLSADAMSDGASIPVAILIAVAVGAGVGLANGIVITVLRVNSIIATVGTATIVAGFISWKTGGSTISGNIPAALTDFGSGNTLGVPRTAWLLLVVAILVFYLLQYTPFGRYLLSIGTNRSAARLVGLKINRLVLLSFVGAGVLAGAAGVLQVARAGAASPQVGETFTLPAIAAAFLSAAAIKPGRFNVWGTLVAIYFLAAINSGLNLAGAQPYVSSWINGAALIIGVALAAALGWRRSAVAPGAAAPS
jgi:ribose transport system permease protein